MYMMTWAYIRSKLFGTENCEINILLGISAISAHYLTMYKHTRCCGECSSTRQHGRPRRMADRAAAPQTAPPALPPPRACF